MERFVTDTHALLWQLCAPKRLGGAARAMVMGVGAGLARDRTRSQAVRGQSFRVLLTPLTYIHVGEARSYRGFHHPKR